MSDNEGVIIGGYPFPQYAAWTGPMTPRDQFALAAMSRYLTSHDMEFLQSDRFRPEDMMAWCYAIADAAMAVREKAT